MAFLAVGGNSALWALSVPDLKVLGAIRAEDDSVRGALASADVDGDGSTEIVMVTKKGRVALVARTTAPFAGSQRAARRRRPRPSRT